MSNSKFDTARQKVENIFGANRPDVDLYRDTPLRYCGYSNEVGESFRPLIPRVFVNLSYAIAISYVLAECADKTVKTYKKHELLGGGLRPAAIIAGDVFLWQMFASVAIPGLVINRITWAAGKLLKNAKIKGMARKWTPTCIGLVAIPFIIKPIDYGVDEAMDNTYRKYLK